MGKQRVRALLGSRRQREGFSLIEVTVLSLLLLVAIGGLSGAVLSSLRLSRTTEESTIADEATRALAARMQNEPFRELFRRYNSDPNDQLGLAPPIPGPAFDVTGLKPRSDDPDGRVGRIVFPALDLPGGGQALREDVVDERLGMLAGEGRDLNGNANGAPPPYTDDVTNDYRLLPVRLIVEWTGAGGDRSYELDLVLVAP